MSAPLRFPRFVRIMLCLLLVAAAPLASADAKSPADPTQKGGLMWNRSGLPAVFPLQVKTPPGPDYFLTLIDVKTGDPALAAYIKGGKFFKVLVPPGVFRLRFATGNVWQGEDDLFGPGRKTQHFELRDPLTFEIRGIGIKAGHVVSLLGRQPGELAEMTRKDQLICQSLRLRISPSIHSAFYWRQTRAVDHGPRHDLSQSAHAAGRDRGAFVGPRYLEDHDLRFTNPRYDLQSRYCG